MPLFTADNAAEMGRRSVLARQRITDSLRSAVQTAALDPALDYPTKRLARVRMQLDLIDQRIHEQCEKAHPDGQTLNWLAAAQARLAEQERQLAGRPTPGALRPSARAPRQPSTLPLPSADPEPE